MSISSVEATGGGRFVVADLEGELDATNAIELETELTYAVGNDAAGLVLDLSALSFVDSLGIRSMFDLAARLRQHGQELRVVVPSGSDVRRSLEIVQLPAAVAVFSTQQQALSCPMAARTGPSTSGR